MSTSPLYDSTRQALQQVLPTIRDSQMETLGFITKRPCTFSAGV